MATTGRQERVNAGAGGRQSAVIDRSRGPRSAHDPRRPAGDPRRVGTTEESPVADLAYIALLVASFAVLALTLRGMEKL